MVTLHITPVYTIIKGLDNIPVIDAISNELSYYEPSYKFSVPFRTGKWDGRRRLLSSTLKFPTGLLQKVTTLLHIYNIPFDVVDDTIYPGKVTPITWQGPSLFDYQENVVSKILSNNRGMVKVSTGGGKTFIIAKTVAE